MIRAFAFLSLLALCQAAAAQTNLNLGSIDADPSLPVEVTAESLSVDQQTGEARFSGNVVIGQGDLRLAAAEVIVVYSEASGEIARLRASGGVTFVTPTEAAEAQAADYDLTAGTLTLTGEVLLTQGANALSANRMVVNLTTGTAQLDGQVRTVLAPQGTP
ncbi:LptA/OstA family protein [Wenxinia marina]|uniref:Organic solvent tolerance-like N-terminal domain-containing protein n=1 Tax=Wenxinia marina DSM 24838 TaxID=1123501 RepID=A0A0D0PHX4_9RHOB|nr:LptA/OstA family protein [Wenxinia marina]KIQ70986.1 hypothetical protein Wenmar_00364 [Wenxinia marina DSM 24838]GGL55740.1 protein-glutamate methyltransferase [Wenxinia marina]